MVRNQLPPTGVALNAAADSDAGERCDGWPGTHCAARTLGEKRERTRTRQPMKGAPAYYRTGTGSTRSATGVYGRLAAGGKGDDDGFEHWHGRHRQACARTFERGC